MTTTPGPEEEDPGALLADPEICQAVIMDHYRQPRCRGECDPADIAGEGDNPACGDRVRLKFRVEEGVLATVRFTGEGCAVSQASASLLAERLEGEPLANARAILRAGAALLNDGAKPEPLLGRCAALSVVAGHPARRRCALVAWDTAARMLAERE